LKKVWVTSLCFTAVMAFFSLTHPPFSFGDSLSESSAVSVPKASKKKKKTKKKHKKAKSIKLKVEKSSAGSQDEVSDQTDVSQQADQSGNKKR
jgi:hypothetical protein